MSNKPKRRGERIRDLRMERGLTQRELSATCDITAQTLSNIENDRYQTLNQRTLEALTKAFGVTAELLLSGAKKSH
jgi:transcriptional regulator with XRE-family HTH domain